MKGKRRALLSSRSWSARSIVKTVDAPAPAQRHHRPGPPRGRPAPARVAATSSGWVSTDASSSAARPLSASSRGPSEGRPPAAGGLRRSRNDVRAPARQAA